MSARRRISGAREIGVSGGRYRPETSERGQAAVFMLAFLGVVLLSAIFLYKSGRLTTEKMQLQNGADAAAYSASLLEARALNFSAYTNRAMVANEVAVGQMLGMLSWADEVTSIGEFFELYGLLLDATVVLAELGVVLNTMGEGLITAGEAMTKGLLVVAPVVVRGLSTINEVYSVSQEVYHLTTVLLATNAIFQALEDNVPGTPGGNLIERIVHPGEQGARLSTMGLVALAGHIPSYVSGFSRRYALKPNENSKETLAGMGQMAATVREGRDPFTSGDAKTVDGIRRNRSWELKGRYHASMDLELVSISATVTFGLESLGGSEIRYKDNSYVWSAVDTAVWADHLSVKIETFFGGVEPHISLPDLPMGGGAFQANNGRASLNIADMRPELRKYGSPPAYGRAAEHLVSWEVAAQRIMNNSVPGGGYGNLRGYRDTMPGPEQKRGLLPFVSPFFLVGAVRPMEDIEGRGPQFAAPLDLTRAPEISEQMAAIAKSEVYFARPDDLSYFRRQDDKIEQGNLFSPFWQARLVKTTDLDRFLALVLQQNIVWINNHDQAQVPGAEEVIKQLKKILGKLL